MCFLSREDPRKGGGGLARQLGIDWTYGSFGECIAETSRWCQLWRWNVYIFAELRKRFALRGQSKEGPLLQEDVQFGNRSSRNHGERVAGTSYLHSRSCLHSQQRCPHSLPVEIDHILL
jgi:hypothetical protein